MIMLQNWTKFASMVCQAGRSGRLVKLFGNTPPATHVPRMKMKVVNMTGLWGERSEGRARLKPSELAG